MIRIDNRHPHPFDIIVKEIKLEKEATYRRCFTFSYWAMRGYRFRQYSIAQFREHRKQFGIIEALKGMSHVPNGFILVTLYIDVERKLPGAIMIKNGHMDLENNILIRGKPLFTTRMYMVIP